jgi:hypothetical protein
MLFPNIPGHGVQENFFWSVGKLVEKQFSTRFSCVSPFVLFHMHVHGVVQNK